MCTWILLAESSRSQARHVSHAAGAPTETVKLLYASYAPWGDTWTVRVPSQSLHVRIAELGTYGETEGKSTCSSCPSGKFSFATMASSISTCLGCPIGTYSLAGASNALDALQGRSRPRQECQAVHHVRSVATRKPSLPLCVPCVQSTRTPLARGKHCR